MNEFSYIAEVRCRGLQCELMINKWKAYRVHDPEPHLVNLKLNLWMLEGRNIISLRGARCPDHRDEREQLRVKIYKAPVGEPYADTTPIVFDEWLEPQCPLDPDPTTYTEVFRHELVMKEAFGRWGWEDAKPYDDGDRRNVEKAVETIYDAFNRRDRAAIKQLFSMRQEEWGRALGVAHDEMEAKADWVLEFYLNDRDWAMSPLDPDQLYLDVGADGRLVQIFARDRQTKQFGPGLQGTGDLGKPFEMGITLSCVEGDWRVVR